MAKVSEKGSVGLVRPQYFTFAEPPNEMVLESGEKLGPIVLAYETYGKLNASRTNAVMALHALSGDAHAAGITTEEDFISAADTGFGAGAEGLSDRHRLGWWDNMIGPGKAFDTDKYFVICSNVIGGCRGSTGPASINPRTGRPYALSFPVVTVGDMVRAQRELIAHLGIERLLCVTGGSLGGMQALEWTVSFPDAVASAIPVATCARLSAQGIAFNEVGRQAIMADPNWRGGDYYDDGEGPTAGLSIARMIGHITYLSDESMRRKFGRRLRDKECYGYDFSLDFEVESYLRHQGESFVKRFDANSYLYITKAIDYFDLVNGHGSLVNAFQGAKARFLLMAFSSDWLYPPYQSLEIVRALKAHDADVSYYAIDSSYGHDAFLLEEEVQTTLISGFLARTFEAVMDGRL